VIEVAKNDENPSAFGPQCIFNWYFDIVKGDIGCTSRGRLERHIDPIFCSSEGKTYIAGLNWLGFNTLTAFNKDDSESILMINQKEEGEITRTKNARLFCSQQ